ncbi:TetR/AcrR family transcriptional regulator [Amycolatopsis samaneae]|uniref:TetR/AcrR family transcriptional regulator n=1 Tax=Amycolatopsis samaneae TaxID=664691 RepID=A0ABW5GNH2_9PSEU
MPEKQPIPSAWTRPKRHREQPALSREHIVSEAVKLLDAEGIDALSMRRLGARLGAGATSLYRHVANRDELIELVVDEVYGEIEVPGPEDLESWRVAVIVCAHGARAAILRHPWLVSVLGQAGLAYLGPNVLRLNDRMLALFEAAGFGTREADQALGTVMAYVIGIGISEAATLTMLGRSGQDEREWQDRLRPAAEEAARDYPRLLDQFAEHAREDPRKIRDDDFAYGLERILDGLENRPAS